MPIAVQCASCGAVHQVADNLAGTQMQCSCGIVMVVPQVRPMPAAMYPPTGYQQSAIPLSAPTYAPAPQPQAMNDSVLSIDHRGYDFCDDIRLCDSDYDDRLLFRWTV